MSFHQIGSTLLDSHRIALGVVGLDSPHATALVAQALRPEFAQRFQLIGAHVGEPTDFPLSASRALAISNQIEEMGVRVEARLNSISEDAEVVIVTAADPRAHRNLLLKLVRPGLVILVDTRLALTVTDAEDVLAAAEDAGATISCVSPRRFLRGLPEDLSSIDEARICGSIAPQSPLHPLAWYGFHHADLLVKLLGPGVTRVSATRSSLGVLEVAIDWTGGRRGAIIGQATHSPETRGTILKAGDEAEFVIRVDQSMFGNLLAALASDPLLARFPRREEMLDVVRIVEVASLQVPIP